MNKTFLKKILTIEDEMMGEEIVIDGYKSIQFGNSLSQSLEKIVKLYAVAVRLEAEAAWRLEVYKVDLQEFYSILDERTREYEIIGKPTEQRIKSYILKDPEYIAQKKQLLEYEKRYELWRGYKMTLDKKFEALRSMLATERLENSNQ